ncbi:uncharacterized protein SCHCODRAFT_02686605 [Schizophyllum commune H4-8]|uniref:uncharacterized protein n=1 Tax=Schizophyllum commune (strain H4-8 / FGSC 9210) TaxID=578458 RepID=UPI00215F9DE1|nr:uncharacterized protein SCHCODRAFT_02686605 [Schizophyllum commune H4-8]KAI5895154.1 hypothetical protein SCHCODRAFT_02686605 [Schizophyllum commune H4-8]
MRSTRDSQAWETGGTMVGTMARTWRGQSRPPLAMQNEAGDGYRCSIPCSSDVGNKVTHAPATFVSYDPEPPEARVRTPRAREASVKASTLAPHSLRLSGSSRQNLGLNPALLMLTLYPCRFIDCRRRARGFLGKTSEEGDTLTPLTAFARGQGGVPRAHSSRRGLKLVVADPFVHAIFVVPEPPEACACYLGEECGRLGIPPPSRGAKWRPPEACAHTLSEGCGRAQKGHGAPQLSREALCSSHDECKGNNEALAC